MLIWLIWSSLLFQWLRINPEFSYGFPNTKISVRSFCPGIWISAALPLECRVGTPVTFPIQFVSQVSVVAPAGVSSQLHVIENKTYQTTRMKLRSSISWAKWTPANRHRRLELWDVRTERLNYELCMTCDIKYFY